MTQFTIRHDVFESNSSDGTRVVATKAVVQSSNLTSGTQFRAQRTLKELFMTITFHSEGGTSEYDSIEALVGDKVAELPDASNGTYLFDGWYTSAVGGTKVTTDTIVSSTIEHLYAHWIAATTLTFNSNGGTISGSTTINAYVGYPLSIKGSTFPTATGPSDTPNFIGFYTSASGGSKITSETVYDGTYTILYAHYGNASYSVDLNGQWFKDDGSGVDPKGNAYALQYTTNPDTSLYDGTYVSYSNWHVNNGYSVMRINLVGYDEFTIYLRSYAESNYDYAIAGNIDQAITSGSPSTYKARTYGNQQSGTAIGSYTKVTYTGLGGGNHFIDVCYRKDSSVDSNQDRGYVLIDNPIPPHPITITFETNGGSEIAQIQMMSGNKITKPTDPTKTDWYFGGWYSDSGLTQNWDFNTVVYEDMTLYAKWRDTELPYDAEVEYLETVNNAPQYIDTGIILKSNSKVTGTFEVTSKATGGNTSYISVFGSRNSNYQSKCYTVFLLFNNSWNCVYARTGQELRDSIYNTLNKKITIVTNGKSFDATDNLGGRSSLTSSGTIENCINTCFLFGMNTAASGGKQLDTWPGSQKCYHFKIETETDVELDLIPVRKDGVGYMYDRVSGQLFGNSGTGNFILGPDKNS